jgi:WD40 repeat protein
MHPLLLAAWSLTLAGPLPRIDCYGDPLPPHAVARLGSVRFQHDDRVQSVAFSPDGKKLVTVSGNYKLWIWDRASGKALLTLGGKEAPVYPYALFLADGKHVVAPTKEGLTVFNAATGKAVRAFASARETWHVLALSPDGKQLAGAASCSQDVYLWDVVSGKELWKLPGHIEGANALAFAPDGGRLAVGCGDGTARLWNPHKDDEAVVLAGHKLPVESVAFPDAGTVWTSSFDHWLQQWDAATGKLMHKTGFGPGRFVLAPDGKQLAPSCGNRHFSFCDPVAIRPQGRCLGHMGWMEHAAYSPDSKLLATVGDDHTLRLWHHATMAEVRPAGGHSGCVSAIAFLPNNETVITGGWDETVRLWEARTGKEVSLRWHTGRVTSVTGSPDGRLLACASGFEGLTVNVEQVDPYHPAYYFAGVRPYALVRFSPDGKRLAAATDNYLQMWLTGPWKQLPRLDLPDPEGTGVLALSPDLATLAVARGKGDGPTWHVELIDVASGKSLRTFEWPGKRVVSLAFSPDGKRLAAGGALDEPHLGWWDAGGGKFHALETDLRGPFYAVAFSPDGRMLASACGAPRPDAAIRLWDTATGKVVARLPGHTSGVLALAFSPNGKLLGSASLDRSALVWDLGGLKLGK